MGGCVIVSEIGSQITFIEDNLPIKKSDLLLKKPIAIFYMIVIWLEKAWLVDKSGQTWSPLLASSPDQIEPKSSTISRKPLWNQKTNYRQCDRIPIGTMLAG